jgi:hypothetical protein
MAAHALRQPSRIRAACRWTRAHVRTARRWTRVHVRRHIPFAIYSAATAAVAVWTICTMVCITR